MALCRGFGIAAVVIGGGMLLAADYRILVGVALMFMGDALLRLPNGH